MHPAQPGAFTHTQHQLNSAYAFPGPSLHPGQLVAGHHLPPTPAINLPARVKQEHSEYGPPSMTGGGNQKGGASEFVKKLYKMLEDSAHYNIVSWGAKGDSFLVKDMNEFTKTVLPLHFKHSNFASFVRQLNKYDFHKVKATEGGQEGIYGDHTWEFRHPNFRADTKKALEFIKRKGPAPRKGGAAAGSSAAAAGSSGAGADGANNASIAQLQQQFSVLQQIQQSMGAHMTSMSSDLHNVYAELVKFQNTFVAQDQLIQNIIQYLVRKESSTRDGGTGTPSPEAQQLLHSYAEIAHASAEQLAELTRRASIAGGRRSPVPQFRQASGQPVSSPSSGFEQDGQSPRPSSMQYGRTASAQYSQTFAPSHLGPGEPASHHNSPHAASPQTRNDPFYGSPRTATAASGSQYYAGPAAEESSGQAYPPTSSVGASANGLQAPVEGSEGTSWKHTPRVLVVEDDVVCRKLSSRFLEVFGCVIDTAVDGIEAVKKMNAQQYDLVFMDIAMPNLDGVSATSIIRQFNASTPIISMTSNSEPNDILTYFSHGMTDVLPKPFTKEALFGMLEKHLVHLTQIKQLVEVPRALGFPESQIQDALASTLAPSYLQSEAMFGQEPLNPYSEMGISEEDFTSVLLSTLTPSNAAGGTPQGGVADGKRQHLDDAGETAKRARYGP